jgi:hypothetical protein
LAVSTLFAACKKDDEETDPKNQMTIDGTEYDFSQGVIENYGIWNSVDAYNFDVTLLTSGFTIHEVNGEIDSISGIGSGINFELFSSDSTDLAIGEYVYDENGDGKAGTFIFGGAVVNFNAETEEGIEYNFSGGTITIASNGDKYMLSFMCQTDENVEVFGIYEGPLKKYDYTDDKKSATIKSRIW